MTAEEFWADWQVAEQVRHHTIGNWPIRLLKAWQEHLVSSKAAEAPGSCSCGSHDLAPLYHHPKCALAPAAPSERADEILKESPVKFQHNGFEHQVDRMAQYVIDTHPGTSLAAAYRAVCEELANRAQARAALSSQEGR